MGGSIPRSPWTSAWLLLRSQPRSSLALGSLGSPGAAAPQVPSCPTLPWTLLVALLEGCSCTSSSLDNPSSVSISFIFTALFKALLAQVDAASLGCPLPREAGASRCNFPWPRGVPAPRTPLLPRQHLSARSQGPTATRAWHGCRCRGHRAVGSLPAWLFLPVFRDLRVAESGAPIPLCQAAGELGPEPGDLGWGRVCRPGALPAGACLARSWQG